ncbi:hypothetical protein LINPERHAP1_LOCUS8919, partial [Linum perenne]
SFGIRASVQLEEPHLSQSSEEELALLEATLPTIAQILAKITATVKRIEEGYGTRTRPSPGPASGQHRASPGPTSGQHRASPGPASGQHR